MTIEEIRKIEEDRATSLNVVHLIKEGNFYHANDWSAWLMTNYPIGEAAKKPMVVTAKRLKNDYVQAFVGFPATSLAKYVPVGTNFNPVSDIQIDVLLDVEFPDSTPEQIREKVDEWKDGLNIQGGKKQHREDRDIREQAPRITRITDIVARLISIPMEDISPKEAYDILRDLRRQVSALF